MPNSYVAHFADGSRSTVEVRGSYGRNELVGVATRGDGYKRIVFFEGRANRPEYSQFMHRDPWVTAIMSDACAAYRAPQLVHARPAESVVV
jgi:hypothetical protein